MTTQITTHHTGTTVEDVSVRGGVRVRSWMIAGVAALMATTTVFAVSQGADVEDARDSSHEAAEFARQTAMGATARDGSHEAAEFARQQALAANIDSSHLEAEFGRQKALAGALDRSDEVSEFQRQRAFADDSWAEAEFRRMIRISG